MSRGSRVAVALGVAVLVAVGALLARPRPERSSTAVDPGSPAAATEPSSQSPTAPPVAVHRESGGEALGSAMLASPSAHAAPQLAISDAGVALPGDGGVEVVAPAPVAPPVAEPSTDEAAPRPVVHYSRPLSPEESLERNAAVHDYVFVRLDEVRRRIAELERSGETRGLRRLRRELERLEALEPEARARVERQAAELAASREAAAGSGDGSAEEGALGSGAGGDSQGEPGSEGDPEPE